MDNFINKEVSQQWAQEQYTLGLSVLSNLDPSIYLKSIQVGDVIASTSGNLRLVLNLESSKQGTAILFLSLLRNNTLKIEGAVLHKISASKLLAIVRRQNSNPLKKFQEVARNLENEKTVFLNTEVLLCCGAVGERLQYKLNQLKGGGEAYSYIDFLVSPDTGEIENFFDEGYADGPSMISLLYNLMGLPNNDQIKTARLDAGCNPKYKENILAACVLANTIANARNLLNFARLAGQR